MSLELIATPIGDPGDITLRAIETLRAADIVIGEERRDVSTLLKRLGLEGKRMELLNEHTRDEDLGDLLSLCRESRVALVTDCGTPGFCDPGARLVALCRSSRIPVRPVPGASSLMCLLSVSGSDMREFLFRGFLPAAREERTAALAELARERRPVILMDTPYRMGRLIEELAAHFPSRRVLLGCDFTQPAESIFEARASDLPTLVGDRKAEFILALYPASDASDRQEQTSGDRSQHPATDLNRSAHPGGGHTAGRGGGGGQAGDRTGDDRAGDDRAGDDRTGDDRASAGRGNAHPKSGQSDRRTNSRDGQPRRNPGGGRPSGGSGRSGGRGGGPGRSGGSGRGGGSRGGR